jgi:hypothetical protein
VEQAIACYYVIIKQNAVMLLSGPVIIVAVTLVMYHLNYYSKNYVHFSTVISGGCAEVLPVVLDDVY